MEGRIEKQCFIVLLLVQIGPFQNEFWIRLRDGFKDPVCRRMRIPDESCHPYGLL